MKTNGLRVIESCTPVDVFTQPLKLDFLIVYRMPLLHTLTSYSVNHKKMGGKQERAANVFTRQLMFKLVTSTSSIMIIISDQAIAYS